MGTALDETAETGTVESATAERVGLPNEQHATDVGEVACPQDVVIDSTAHRPSFGIGGVPGRRMGARGHDTLCQGPHQLPGNVIDAEAVMTGCVSPIIGFRIRLPLVSESVRLLSRLGK